MALKLFTTLRSLRLALCIGKVVIQTCTCTSSGRFRCGTTRSCIDTTVRVTRNSTVIGTLVRMFPKHWKHNLSSSESTQTSSPPNLFLFSPEGELKKTSCELLEPFQDANFEDFVYFKTSNYWMKKLHICGRRGSYIWRGVSRDDVPPEVKAIVMLLPWKTTSTYSMQMEPSMGYIRIPTLLETWTESFTTTHRLWWPTTHSMGCGLATQIVGEIFHWEMCLQRSVLSWFYSV